MDAEAVTQVVTIIISVVALSVSAVLALRQTRTSAAGYALPVVLQVFEQFRTDEFYAARHYVYHVLNKEFDSPVPYSELPLEVQAQVRAVAGRYDDLGKLVAHGIIDEQLIIGANGSAIRRVWTEVEPFVRLERATNRATAWVYLEDLANRVDRTPPQVIYEKLRLDYVREQ